jgi:hypothetical protein
MIKPDPDAAGASPGMLDEDDIYEDAGDLEFNTDAKFQSLYLARIPRYVWEAWSKLDDDAEIRIGTIRQSAQVMPDGQQKVRHDIPHGKQGENSDTTTSKFCWYIETVPISIVSMHLAH